MQPQPDDECSSDARREERTLKERVFGPGAPVADDVLIRVLRDALVHVTSQSKVIEYRSEDDILKEFQDDLPSAGAPLSDVLLRCWDKVVSGSIHQSHPRYLAFPDSGNSIAGLAAELLIPILNQNLIATTKSAPTATFAEIQVLWWLRRLIGFSASRYPTSAIDAAGLMTGGGVAANAVALLAARCRAYPLSRKFGLVGPGRRPAVFIPGDTISHYSHLASAWWTGLGEENIVEIEVADDFSMSALDLERQILRAIADDREPVAIISQAGDSRTMAIDPLDDIASIAEAYGIWLHVDACHGSGLLFSKTHRKRLNGLERADSVAMDPHKILCLPYSSSALLFKSAADLAPLAKSTDITIQKGSYDLGQVTPFAGSRPFESLKLWMLLQHLGVEGAGAMVEHRYEMARLWKRLVDQSPIFVSLNSVTVNSVVFSLNPDCVRLGPPDPQQLGDLNQAIHDRTYMEGDSCIHTFDIRDYGSRAGFARGTKLRVLGVTVGNPLTDERQIKRAFQTVAFHANHVLGGTD